SLSFVQSDLEISIQYCEKMIKNSKKAKDNYMLSVGPGWKANLLETLSNVEDDPEVKRNLLKEALELIEESKITSNLSNNYTTTVAGRRFESDVLEKLANYETDLGAKKKLLERIIETTNEILINDPEGKFALSMTAFHSLSLGLLRLSEISTNNCEKQEILLKSLGYIEKSIKMEKNIIPDYYLFRVIDLHKKAEIQLALAKLQSRKEEKITILEDAVQSMEICLNLIEKDTREHAHLESAAFPQAIIEYGHTYYDFGAILKQLYLLINKKNILERALEAYNKSTLIYKQAALPTYLAESYWQMAKILDQLFEHSEASKYYQLASKAYLRASQKLPKFKEFYDNHSRYMFAWSEIEQAKYNHSRENYLEAKIHYENASKLHLQLDNWHYLSGNYSAWAKMEQAEELSRTEKPQEAKENFQEAIEFFQKTEINITNKIHKNTISEEDFLIKILKASKLRQKYCQARILMEKAKLLEREGKHLDSSISYNKSAQRILEIIDKIEVESEQKELIYVEILCRAWEKMMLAGEKNSSELYLEAAELFKKAKEQCFTRKASLWALGNSNFCRGLAAGVNYQTNLDLSDHSKAKGYIKNASTNYLQAGFKHASEYAKATQRLFDAFVFINRAESEIEQEKRAKQYQMAESLLQIALGSFLNADQPEKITQVKKILENVKEEKAIAISLSQVMQAPTIASTTSSFFAPGPTSDVSIGLENFEHANVQANIVADLKEVKVGESFCLSVEFVNTGRESALLLRVDDFVPSDFVVVKKPEIYRLEDKTLNMKGKQIAPLKFVEVKLTLQPSKKGKYLLNPKIYYLDELGQNKFLLLKTLEINVKEVFLKDRVSTGSKELDSLMLGGIPNEYAVILTGSPSDERQKIITNFLEQGTKSDEIVFYVSTESEDVKDLLGIPNFFLFLCNPKPKTRVPVLPNIYKIRSKTDLTNLSISLTKAERNLDIDKKKRICIEIVSDVLLTRKAEATRRWISELITDLGSKGFSILAVVDPLMHASEDLYALINLFDGEVSISQSNDSLDCKKSIQIKKLRNQDYIKNPICLT
ncbi:MAG: ATPase domain-containing protein, partial [Candidatus Bathyarchaeota archaeon]